MLLLLQLSRQDLMQQFVVHFASAYKQPAAGAELSSKQMQSPSTLFQISLVLMADGIPESSTGRGCADSEG